MLEFPESLINPVAEWIDKFSYSDYAKNINQWEVVFGVVDIDIFQIPVSY